MEKAFERALHEKLLCKLEFVLGFRSRLLHWINDYLTDIKHRSECLFKLVAQFVKRAIHPRRDSHAYEGTAETLVGYKLLLYFVL